MSQAHTASPQNATTGEPAPSRTARIRHFLHQLDYPGKDVKAIGKVDNKIVLVPDTRYKEKNLDLGHD